ncbi:hypothetical protein EI546_13670 [Aequorivita sp. H23M31]|uniref:Uncharacterized protein n=1 Tax=Aequorivita ciconiae TaxID=2494375 RepID=A0A410G7U2_9FLAO|nr:hypothetical protein EI546_13670 [Aequorivita sp. H23M31]
MQSFNDIKELLAALRREDKLLYEMFGKRKSLEFKLSYARELVDYDEARIEYLIEKSVLRQNGGLLEIDDLYLRFFEQVLEVNEEINLASIDENIKSIQENIVYFLNENNEHRKHAYLREIKRTFRKIGIVTIRSVIDLRRKVDNTFKNEPNFKNKQLKLKHLDEKRIMVRKLQGQAIELINENQPVFFKTSQDEELKRIITELKIQLNECSHNLIEIEKQIINYLNQIKQQGLFLEKLRKLKYLKAHFTIEAETDIEEQLSKNNLLIFERRQSEPLNLSIDFVINDERAFEAIKKAATNFKTRIQNIPQLAETIATDFLDNNVEQEIMINLEEVRNHFLATGDNLFSFIKNYNFNKEVSFEERVTIYCQLISLYDRELKVTNEYENLKGVEYAMVYPK